MPPRPGGGPPAPLNEDPIAQLIVQMAQSSQQLTNAVAALSSSQASFMRSAADADVNICLSKSHPFIPSELMTARSIDNTVDDEHRSGMSSSERGTLPLPPTDYVSDPRDPDYDPSDSRHANTYGKGHDDATLERSDAMNAFHRERGRNIRIL